MPFELTVSSSGYDQKRYHRAKVLYLSLAERSDARQRWSPLLQVHILLVDFSDSTECISSIDAVTSGILQQKGSPCSRSER